MLASLPVMAPGIPGALSITVNKGVIAEGEEVTFSIDTARLLANITLKWHLEGTAVPSDFEIPSGTITTNNGIVTISVKTVADGLLEGDENFKLVISTVDDQRILSSGFITILDTSKPTPDGQQDFIVASATPYEFIVPDGVTSICAVLVGGGGGGASAGRQGQFSYGVGRPGAGGGLRWINNVPVTPGEILLITTGAGGIGGQYPQTGAGNGYAGDQSRITRKSTGELIAYANGGAGGSISGTAIGGTGSPLSAAGASPIKFIGGGNGGNGGTPSSATGSAGGGGGAGGYSGNGGTGYSTSNSAGGGGGGGGGYSNSSGGGVGLLGQGLNGRAGTGSVPAGGGGSNGAAGISPQSNVGGRGGDYGGGATSAVNYQAQTGLKGGQGGHGAVRIIWGVGRAYPATRTGNL